MSQYTEYVVTERGKDMLHAGDRLMEVVDDAMQDGKVSAKEISELTTMTLMEAEYLINVLKRQGYLKEAPIQGVEYYGPIPYTLN